jgi:hypothetical protein
VFEKSTLSLSGFESPCQAENGKLRDRLQRAVRAQEVAKPMNQVTSITY